MLVYRVFVRKLKNPLRSALAQAVNQNPVGNSDPSWVYEVHACNPEQCLLGRGTARSEADAVEEALKLLDHSNRTAWRILSDGPLHLSRR